MPERKENEENWTTEIDSKYRLVLLAAKRSKQLQKGARPRVQSVARKSTRVALEEVERGVVRYTHIQKEQAAEEE
ncbi:MAG TPA: DNA-directed RNA polymerase subunit omega [Blastocatellia bacterium]|nr:DNA-directed RNA polymerase subunit omega [Blastocatellia bacterium]